MSDTRSIQVLTLAVCLFNDVAALDFIGPMELFGFLSPQRLFDEARNPGLGAPKYALQTTYVSPTENPIKPSSGPIMTTSTTYDNAKEQFDILLIPGGTKCLSIIQIMQLVCSIHGDYRLWSQT